jgi:hypothetical protein
MDRFSQWWTILSGESKAAIIAAIVGPCAAELLGLRKKMIQSFYMRTLERLEDAKVKLRKEAKAKLPSSIIDANGEDESFYPLEQVAKRAGIWMWVARRATRWKSRVKIYTELMR